MPDPRSRPRRRGHIHVTPDDFFNVKGKTTEVEQRGVRTRGYQEIHITGLDRFPASYRTEYTHVTQAALGRGRENLPPEPPGETRDPATVPAAVDLAHFTEPEVRPLAARHAGLAS